MLHHNRITYHLKSLATVQQCPSYVVQMIETLSVLEKTKPQKDTNLFDEIPEIRTSLNWTIEAQLGQRFAGAEHENVMSMKSMKM